MVIIRYISWRLRWNQSLIFNTKDYWVGDVLSAWKSVPIKPAIDVWETQLVELFVPVETTREISGNYWRGKEF